jgi:hypothetical protein
MTNKTISKDIYNKLPAKTRFTGCTDLLSPFLRFDSAPRIHMGFAQKGQAVVSKNPSTPIFLTGYEKQLMGTTIIPKFPYDCQVIAVIETNPLYQDKNKHAINKSNLTFVIFRCIETGTYDCLELPGYYRAHDVFAIKMHDTHNIRPGNYRKDTMLRETDSFKGGVYASDIRANVINASMVGVIEDGLCVSKSLLLDAAPVGSVTATLELGNSRYPVSTYGKPGEFRPVPKAGEKIREDKVVYATRSYDDLLDPILMLQECIEEVYVGFDEIYFAPMDAIEAVAIDVIAIESVNPKQELPDKMSEALRELAKPHKRAYAAILDVYRRIKKEEGTKLRITPEFDELLSYALSFDIGNPNNRKMGNITGRIQQTYKARDIESWFVDIEIAWRFKLGYGSKFTDVGHGCKGVVCEIREDEDMPHDDFGNYANYIQYGRAPVARMNTGGEVERYFGAFMRDVTLDIGEIVKNEGYDKAFEYALIAIDIFNPKLAKMLSTNKRTPESRKSYIDNTLKDILTTILEPDAEWDLVETYEKVMAFRPPNKSQLTYKNYDGTVARTDEAILIGPKMITCLEKSSFKPAAVSTGLRQHHGLLASSNNKAKTANPVQEKASRSWGESEYRNVGSSIGGEAVSYTVEISTSALVSKQVTASFIANENPFMVWAHADKEKIPYGSGRDVNFVKALLLTQGTVIGDSA